MRLKDPPTRLLRRAVSAAALAALPLLSGCFWLDGPQSTFDPNGPVAREQLDLFYVTCWVTLAIFILVGSALAYATIKFRARTDSDEHAEPPEQHHGNPVVEMSPVSYTHLTLPTN